MEGGVVEQDTVTEHEGVGQDTLERGAGKAPEQDTITGDSGRVNHSVDGTIIQDVEDKEGRTREGQPVRAKALVMSAKQGVWPTPTPEWRT